MYMVTICVHDMEHRFGTVIDGQMCLNMAGEIADRQWRRLPRRFPNVSLDAYVVMPNHVHGILEMVDEPNGASRLSLGRIVGAYKSLVSTEYAACVRAEMFPPYDRSL
jgi:REP element-mobilizing transposase RayT